MQVLITGAGPVRTRVLHIRPVQLAVAAALALVLLLVAAGAVYHVVLWTAARQNWPGVGSLVQGLVHHQVAQRERWMQQNLDAMALRVGEMQAKLLKLQATSERVSALAGVTPNHAPAPASAAASAPAAAGRLPKRGADAGPQGGPYVPQASASVEALLGRVSALGAEADQSSAIYALIESRLFEKRLQSLMVPSSRPVDGPVGSGFGLRADPFSGRSALHTGLDFPAPWGAPVRSAAGGVVAAVELHPQYGHMVELDHGRGLVTRYAHASKVLVRPGDLVKRGQRIAQVGSSGRSTGPHLHFEVLLHGVHQDPAKFLAIDDEGPDAKRFATLPALEAAAAAP